VSSLVVAADAAAWLGVAVAVVGVVVSALVAVTRFRPKFTARIDRRRQAIRVDAVNRGRLEGYVHDVAVVDEHDDEHPCEFAGLPDGRFETAKLARARTQYLIIRASRTKGPFPDGVRVKVKWGRKRQRSLTPEPTNTSYYGEDLKSDWT
jgi:hypothetical protein